MRVRINKSIIIFLASFLSIIAIFSILAVQLSRPTEAKKTREQETLTAWQNRIGAVQSGKIKMFDKMYILNKYGAIYYKYIWGSDAMQDRDPKDYSSIQESLDRSNIVLLPALEFLLTREYAFTNLPLGWPVKSGLVTSEYGGRISPFGFSKDFHTGYDFANIVGTPIYATADGEVILAGGGNSGYGYYVKILHAHGFVSLYAHTSAVLVEKGQRVRRGDQIALLGATGSATGPHVHYEIRLQNPNPANRYEIFLNPLPYIKEKF